jgi:hypothetical protein
LGAERGGPSTKAFCMSTFTSAVLDGMRSNAAIMMFLQSQLAIHGTFSMQVFQLIVLCGGRGPGARLFSF